MRNNGFAQGNGVRCSPFIKNGVNRLIGIPRELRRLALERARTYMLDHLEQDGTFYSYYSSTFLMIFALLSLGYKKTDPIITKAIEGIRAMKCEINGLPHMQYTTANVWNTSLIGRILLYIFQYITWLTVQHFAYFLQGGKTDRLRFAIFQDGQVRHRNADLLGQLGHAHFSFCQHNIDIDDNRHMNTSDCQIIF